LAEAVAEAVPYFESLILLQVSFCGMVLPILTALRFMSGSMMEVLYEKLWN